RRGGCRFRSQYSHVGFASGWKVQISVLTDYKRKVGGNEHRRSRTNCRYYPIMARVRRQRCLREPVVCIDRKPMVPQRRKVRQPPACIDLPQSGTGIHEIDLAEFINQDAGPGMSETTRPEQTTNAYSESEFTQHSGQGVHSDKSPISVYSH